MRSPWAAGLSTLVCFSRLSRLPRQPPLSHVCLAVQARLSGRQPVAAGLPREGHRRG